MSNITFQPIKNYDLQVASDGEAKSRIIIIKSSTETGTWRRVENAQILIIGDKALRELTRFAKENGRPAANDAFPGGIAGRAYTNLRKYLNLSK